MVAASLFVINEDGNDRTRLRRRMERGLILHAQIAPQPDYL
jgi:hypothetical protein